MQHAAMFDVFNLDRGIDAALEGDVLHGSVGHRDGAWHLLEWLDGIEARDRDSLVPAQAKGLAAVPVCEFKRNHAHAHKVGAVDTLEAFAITALTPRSAVPLAAQSREEPAPYCSPPKITKRRACGLMRHGRVIDRGLRAVRPFGVATFNAVQHLVLDADVGEGAAHHDFVVAAARAVELNSRRGT